MRINSKALALASGLVAATTFSICALAVALAPGATMTFLGWVLHLDLSGMARTLTFSSFCGGLLLFSAFIAACTGTTAALYNRLAAGRAVA